MVVPLFVQIAGGIALIVDYLGRILDENILVIPHRLLIFSE